MIQMKIIEFINIVDKKNKENPFLFEGRDIVATEEDIQETEVKLGIILPQAYRDFVKKYGGGDFGYIDIFSANKKGYWYIVKHNQDFKHYLPKDFIAISDDQTGGYYGYKIVNHQCDEQVCYWHYDGGFDSKVVYSNIFEFIIDVGLRD